MAGPNDPVTTATAVGGLVGLDATGMQQVLASLQGSGVATSSSDRPVWWGTTTGNTVTPDRARPGYLLFGGPGQDDIRYESDSTAWLYQVMLNDPDTYAKIKQQLVEAGIASANASPVDIYRAWAQVVSGAADLYTANNAKISPLELLDHMAGAVGGAGSGPTTTRYTSTSLSTPGEINAQYQQVAQPMIGRMPAGGGPVEQVQAAQRANPTVSTVTTDAQGNQTRTDTGGLSAAEIEQIMRNRAMAEPDYGAYQAATTYMDVLRSILGPAV